MFAFRVLFIFLISFSALLARAEFEVPPLTGPVVDRANLLRTSDERILREWLRSVNSKGIAQVQILTVPNLGGLTIEQAGIEIVDDWQLGDKQKDNGLLILVANDERKIRIEVGQGLEGVIPDVIASRIIREAMTPLFRQGSPSQGIVLGTYQVLKTIDPEFNPDEAAGLQEARRESLFNKYEGLFFFLFIILILILRAFFFPHLGRRTAWGRGPYIGGGPWGGGSGWGGGWSGGGGGFSGGGASGGW